MKKTVLFFSTSSGPGGAERLISKLAAGLDQTSFRSVVCLFRSGWLRDQCERNGIPTYVIPNVGILDFAWLRKFVGLIKTEKVSIIHAHEFDAIVHGTMAAFFAGIPVVATIHGKNYFWEKLSRRMAYRLVSRYSKMVAVSEDLRKFITEQVGIPSQRIKVIYNGIDQHPLVPKSDVKECTKEIGLTDDQQIVGTVGSLYAVKGHKYLLAAVPLVVQECPQARFVIVGRGEQEEELRNQVEHLDIKNYVHFLGLRDDIPRLLAMMRVFVLPSLSEGLSVAALEAMAAGKPVIATSVGGNPELVLQNETGLLVPSMDVQALATSIIRVLQDREFALQLGANGLKRVQAFFDIHTMTANYQQLYVSN